MPTDFSLLITASIPIQNPEIEVGGGQSGLILANSRVIQDQGFPECKGFLPTDFSLLITARIAIQNPEIVVGLDQIGLIFGHGRVFQD